MRASLPLLLALLPLASSDVAILGDISAPSPGAAANVFSYLTAWSPAAFATAPPPGLSTRYPYLTHVELFTATGGCYSAFPGCSSSRDLLNDPRNASSGVNVSSLLAPLANLLSAGLTPHIVTGNVPISFSSHPHIGGFGVNAALPDSLPAYRAYIRDIAAALVAAFGLSQVRSWRWGCFTEFNNQDWLVATAAEFADLYDYTACGLEDALGVGFVDISVHACVQCGGGAWDPLLFLEHAAHGSSACTGGRVPLSAIGNSFYEHSVGDPGTLGAFSHDALSPLDHAHALGLPTSRFGIDEGRLLWGPEGPLFALTTRAVGDAYQGSWDALFYALLVNASTSAPYYARWGVSTAGAALFTPLADTADTVAANVAALTFKLVGGARVSVTNTSVPGGGEDDARSIVNAVVVVDGCDLRILAFHHHPSLNASATLPPALTHIAVCGLPPTSPRGLVIGSTETRVDGTHGNAWPVWQAAAAAANLSYAAGDYQEGWSASSDSPPLASPRAVAALSRALPAMQAAALLVAEPLGGGGAVVGADGCVRLDLALPPHGVALVELPGVVRGGAGHAKLQSDSE